jgi:WD40 repeat protein
VAAASQNKAWIWNIATEKYMAIVTSSSFATPSTASTPRGYLRSLVWSPDGSRLAVGTNPVQVVSPTDGTMMGQSIPVYVFWPTTGNDFQATITALAWSPDNTMLAVAALRSGDNGCVTQIWSVEPQLLLKTIDCQNSPGGVSSLSWSADGRFVAAANGQNVEVWDWKAQTSQMIFSQPISNETNVAWSPDPNVLAFVNSTTTQVWNVSTQTMVSQYPHTRNGVLSWSPTGRYLATANNSQVVIWDTSNGTHIYTYTGNFHYVRSLAWSPRGNYLVSGESSASGYNFAHIWAA